MNAVIIGPGVIGKATGSALGIERYVRKNDDISDFIDADYFFLCVPTPSASDGTQDTSNIEIWLEKIAKYALEKTIIIRSTVLPGTTDKLSKKYPLLTIAHVPEFLTEGTALEDERDPEFVVIGCKDILAREKIKEIFHNVCPPSKFILCDPTTAELIKYSMNSFFALKVIYANQLWDVAKEVGANYEKVKEALESHKWGSENGWDVWHGGFRGFSGKCLPKDLYAFTKRFKLPLLDTVRQINKKLVSTTI